MAMTSSDGREPPPVGFYSADGSMYWTAERPADADELEYEEPYEVQGSVIRLMTEIGGPFPLWDEGGSFDYDPAWLQQHLGLDPQLSAALRHWGEAADDWRVWEGSWQEWRREGQRLFDAVSARLPTGLTLVDRRSANEK